ncbi:cupin domain-containing protein [Sorangium sp. So ce448]|uniref:cupin domain-containing protein n=1 Tax=Sorangium sp. So ce448 TaxID=3133314 RepID=UPI003F5D7A99
MFDAQGTRSILVAGLMVVGLTACAHRQAASPPAVPATSGSIYHADILKAARSNTAYRRVVFTGATMQIVLMSIPPGGDIGEEEHRRVEQILFCAEGTGRAVIRGVDTPFRQGDVVFVASGVRHNFVNDGSTPLKIYTIYSPPNHLHGRVQQTKADAEADIENQEFNRRVDEPGRSQAR